MWSTIISFALPLFAKWVEGCGKDAATASKAAYDEATDTFSEDVIRGGMIQMHHAIKLAKKDMTRKERREHKISRTEIREQTIATLRRGLTATPEEVTRCAKQAESFPDLDDDDLDDELQ